MKNFEEQYLDLLSYVLENGVKKEDRTGTGTLSIFGYQLRHDMSDGKFPLLTTKEMHFKGIVTELLWFLRGDTNIKYLLDNNCNIWNGDCYMNFKKICSLYSEIDYDIHIDDPNTNSVRLLNQQEFVQKLKTDESFLKTWGNLGKIYGYQWRNWGVDNIDQIHNVLEEIKNNPDSRRLMVTAWNPTDIPNQVLPPCHFQFQFNTTPLTHQQRVDYFFKVKQPNKYVFDDFENSTLEQQVNHLNLINIPLRKLNLMYNMRSNDLPLGKPYNIASYALLLSIFAKLTNMIAGEVIANIGDAHIYLNQIEPIKEQLKRKPFSFPEIDFSERVDFSGGIDTFLDTCRPQDIKLINYQSHPKIYIPLSN